MEMIEVYSLSGRLIGKVGMDEYYLHAIEEFRTTGKITKKIKSVRIMLLKSDGHIYVQRRSGGICANSGLYDKTVGGHIAVGISDDDTAVKECREELGIRAMVAHGKKDFTDKLRSADLSRHAVLMAVSHEKSFRSVRKRSDMTFTQPYINTTYIGYYDGGTMFFDGEVSGMKKLTAAELAKEIKSHPGKYTEDLKFMLKKERKYLVPAKKAALIKKGK
jgi:isopentenyldiphosphate isomerase